MGPAADRVERPAATRRMVSSAAPDEFRRSARRESASHQRAPAGASDCLPSACHLGDSSPSGECAKPALDLGCAVRGLPEVSRARIAPEGTRGDALHALRWGVRRRLGGIGLRLMPGGGGGGGRLPGGGGGARGARAVAGGGGGGERGGGGSSS